MTKPDQHIHGGVPQIYFEKFGIPPRPVLDYSVNVSPLGPPKVLEERWRELSNTISSYPSIHGDGIAEYYIRRFGLTRGNILPGNGSTECLYLVPRVMGFKRVAIVTPSFHDYERSCRLAGATITEIPLSVESDFIEPSDDVLAVNLERVDALMLGNPNNPTNTTFSEEAILKLADNYPDKWILADEAFIQFVPEYTNHTLIQPDRIRKNILVFHSLTKFYDIPGIRLGCAIGHPETIDRLQAYKEPWTVNGIAEKTAELLINCHDYEAEVLALVERERSRFMAELSMVGGIQLFPSGTNYFLAQWLASSDLDDLLKALLTEGIYVRDCRNFRHLDENFFRFTIKRAEENTRFITILRNISDRFSR